MEVLIVKEVSILSYQGDLRRGRDRGRKGGGTKRKESEGGIEGGMGGTGGGEEREGKEEEMDREGKIERDREGGEEA